MLNTVSASSQRLSSFVFCLSLPSSSMLPRLALVPNSLALNSSSRSSRLLSMAFCSSRANGTANFVDKLTLVPGKNDLGCSRRTFLDARTEEDLLSGITKEMEAGRLPLNVARGMEELYQNYRKAVLQSKNPRANEIILSNMAIAFDRIFRDVEEPFNILQHHKAVREPFDYYMFVQNYIRPLIDFRSSYVGNISLFYEIEAKLQRGENIFLLSNHQTEADPAVIALLLETTHRIIAENISRFRSSLQAL